jgi:hypothetical protein
MKVRTRLFRAIATIGVLASMSAPGIAAADAPSEDEPAECSSRNSERATVAQIAANASAYQGRCVAVDATMRGRSLFDSVDGVYLQPTDSLNPSSSGLRIGLDNISRRNVEGYRSVSILGRVQDCETIRNCVYASLAENEVVMISGYCHSHNGAYLWVHDLRFRRGQAFERRMGSYARSDYGDLVAAPDDWPFRTKVAALASEFLQALRTSDRDKLANIHFRNVGLEREDDEAELLQFLLKDRQSPFRTIRTATTSPQQIFLLERSRLESPESEDFGAVVCFCREKDCTGRWPIARFDADNVPTRPYACTQIEPYAFNSRDVPHFSTQFGKSGLVEPEKSR